MKISRLAIADYQQFKWLDLDLTYREGHPKAGQPLDKVCFIGMNGTGKTTLLWLLSSGITHQKINYSKSTRLLINYVIDEKTTLSSIQGSNTIPFFCRKEVEQDLIENVHLIGVSSNDVTSKLEKYRKTYEISYEKILTELNKNRLHVYIPSESIKKRTTIEQQILETNLSQALNLKKHFPVYHRISLDNFKEFWNILTFYTNKRRSDEFDFLNANENETVGKLKRKFAENNPNILQVIAELWSKILDRAGLYFDYEKAKHPLQLGDQLEAYIRLNDNETIIPYDKLSSGIQDMICRLGYLASLYFERDIDWATALIDEPENSLFVDLQYNIIELYEEVCPNTQLFFATHSPIIAAQFHPDERVILEFDHEGYVTASRGVAAEGDDPNDVLIGDFKRDSVLGKVGEEKWKRYVQLIHLMENETDEKKKIEHAKEFMKIGSDYKFGAVMP